MNQLIIYEAERLIKIWIKENYNAKQDFDDALSSYHSLNKILAGEIYSIFRKWFNK